MIRNVTMHGSGLDKSVNNCSADNSTVDAASWTCFEQCLDRLLVSDGPGMISFLEKLNQKMRIKTLNIVVNGSGAGGTLMSYAIRSDMTAVMSMDVIHKLIRMGIPTSVTELHSLVIASITKANIDFIRIIEALFMSFPGLTKWADDFLCAAVKYSNFPAVTSIASVGGNCQAVFPDNGTLLHVAVASSVRFRGTQRQQSGVDADTAFYTVGVHRNITMFLLRNGADPKIKNFLGETAIDVAARHSFAADITNMLRTARFLSCQSASPRSVTTGPDKGEDEGDRDYTSRFRQCVTDVKTLYTDMLPFIPLFASSFDQNFQAKKGFSFAP
jgi:hypothetical protein